MKQEIGTIERAFQLAEQSASIEQIRNGLKKEGYSNVDAHLSGSKIRSDLSRIIKQGAQLRLADVGCGSRREGNEHPQREEGSEPEFAPAFLNRDDND